MIVNKKRDFDVIKEYLRSVSLCSTPAKQVMMYLKSKTEDERLDIIMKHKEWFLNNLKNQLEISKVRVEKLTQQIAKIEAMKTLDEIDIKVAKI